MTLAYIDPGTGSALLYVVTGIVVSAFFALRGLYYRLTDLTLRKQGEYNKCNIAIHSEDARYEITFMPVLRALAARGIEVSYFTMYDRGDDAEPLPPKVLHHVIPDGLVGYAELSHLQARVLATTTPQLDVMTFRRSKRVEHYCYIPHALGESRYVRPYAYDYFDSILCCGPVFKSNVRKLESIRRSHKKQLFETGVPHYDEMVQKAPQPSPVKSRPLVLIAPSWGPLSLFESFGTDFVGKLAMNYNVVVRPHPQMRVSSPGLYQKLLALDGVEVDTQRTPESVLARADILLSDISGIMHEFAFIYLKPVIIVDRKMEQAGLEGELLGGDSELAERCQDIILPISPSEIESVSEKIESTLRSYDRETAMRLRQELVYNFGAAGPSTAAHLEEILSCLS